MKPNILFVVTDQQRADHCGFMGNTQLRTPHLDTLATNGMVFENAWVSNPVCMPNRSTMLTGRMPSAHGVIFNDRSLDWNANTFVRRLRSEGYRSALIGKSHLQHGASRNSVVPFRGEGAVKSPYPKGWDEVENFERYLDRSPEDPADYYGFDHIELTIDHGSRVTGHHYRWALEQGAREEDIFSENDASAPGSHRSSEWWQVYCPPYEPRFHSTSFVTERTMAFIDECGDEPWVAWCSYPDPHHPMTPPGEWFFRHRPEDMVLPESRFDSLEDAPAHLRQFSAVHPADQRNWVAPCGYGSDQILKEAMAATYGLVEMIDDGVGQILNMLEARGLRDDTIVVFTSDHGDMMGEHSLFLKGFMHYRGTLQVPLVIDAPGLRAGRTNELASSIDLATTLLELCEVAGYDGMQGVSLVPLLKDPGQTVRDHVLIEDDIATIASKLTGIPTKTRTLVTKNHRYTRNSKGEEQLFDLVADRDEMQDIKKSDPPARAAMVDRLTGALIEADDVARGAPSQD